MKYTSHKYINIFIRNIPANKYIAPEIGTRRQILINSTTIKKLKLIYL